MSSLSVRLLVAGVVGILVMLVLAGGALATSCLVADKPAGAGVGGAFYSDSPDRFAIEIPCPAQLNGSDTHGVQGPAPGVCG
jgi:hypothetical protein